MNRVFCLSALLLSFLLFGACDTGQAGKSGDVPELPATLKLPEKRSSKPKIVAFGDSLTAGFGLSEKESYPFLLQKKLEQEGFDYEVINAGVSGDTSLGGLERLDWVLGQDDIKVLILELGANDLLRGVPVAEMHSNLDKIITRSKAKGVEVLLCGMLAPDTMGKEYQKEFSDAFPELATKHDVAYLPFLLEGIALNKELNQQDGIHPNAKGTEMMMSNVYQELKPVLKKLESAKPVANPSK